MSGSGAFHFQDAHDIMKSEMRSYPWMRKALRTESGR